MTNQELLLEIERLKKENLELKGVKIESPEIPTFSFSKIDDTDLEQFLDIEIVDDETIFNQWFDNDIVVDKKTVEFLENLIKKEKRYIRYYNEEDLKVNFIVPIINLVDFKTIDENIRAFYEERLTYKNERFIFSGTVDFMVSKGFKRPKEPYFFIQEFKKRIKPTDPEPQLIAQMISAVELNKTTTIKGAFITGAIWNFVILEKLEVDKYRYFLSDSFDSVKIEDLTKIYKNLQFVKYEIKKMVRGENNDK